LTRDELKALLNERSDTDFVDRELLGRRPWIFDSDASFITWRGTIAAELGCPPDTVCIVGSAATGYSLSPLKPGRPFRPTSDPGAPSSDIDLALVDAGLFTAAWDVIVLHDRARRLGGSDDARSRTRLDMYWGVVGHRSVPVNTDPARRILTAISAVGRLPPLRGLPVRCRVYRRLDDLRAYHVNSLRQLRFELSGQGRPANG
jgi:hypothetical protein